MHELIKDTLGSMLEKLAERYPNDEAIKYTDRDYRRTWREFNDECDKIARAFMSLGIQKGDNVAIWSTNTPAWLMTLFASAKIGAVLVTVNTAYKVFEAEYLLRQSDTKLLVMIDGFKDSDYVGIINELCPDLKDSLPGEISSKRLPRLKTVVYAGENDCPPGMVNWDSLYTYAERVSYEDFQTLTKSLSCDDVVNMQYTSGTTGFPKGVMLTHSNIINNGKTIGDGMKFTHDDKLCIPVPFFHCFGLVLAIMASFTHATSIVPIPSYRPVPVMQALQNEKCTAVHGVPTMFIAMLEHPEFKNFDFSSLRTGIMAGSPCPIKIMERVVKDMNMRDIVIVFGQTEASPGCTMTTATDSIEKRVTTVGRDFPGTESKLVDPVTGEDITEPNVPGEFCSRGYHIMKGYYNMPEATAAVIDKDGWLHTGDLAQRDEDGYYKITGRLKDMIIRGGENIYPKELEEFLYNHPKVKDVQVIGVPSADYGEEVMACIILREGETSTEQEMKDYCRERVARHKVPSYIHFMDSFPMTASGKIQKYILREQAVERLKLHDAANIETA